MADSSYIAPPPGLEEILGREAYDYLLQLHRHVYGDKDTLDGTLGPRNTVKIEGFETAETDSGLVLKPTGASGGIEFSTSPGVDAEFLLGAAHADLSNGLTPVVGTNTVFVKDTAAGTFKFNVSPQGAGSLLDADLLDGLEAAAFALLSHVHSAADITSGLLVHERGGLEADVSAGDGFVEIKGGATTVIKSNLVAAVAPGANDDSSAGYGIGSTWIDTTADKAYLCLDATPTAAVWTETTSITAAAPVDSVFGRTGVVVAAANDYTWAQVDKATSDIADITTRAHASLTGIGSNAHSVIDTHLASTSNPHSVTAVQAGAQPLDATLTALAGLATGADKLAYSTGADTFAEVAFTAAGRALIDDANASAQRTTLGLVIGTDVQAFDATLLSIAALGTAADKLAYTTALDTWAETPLTAAARTVLDDATVDAMLTTLGGTAFTGTGGLVRATSPTIVTPTIASFANAAHSHQNAAGGATLDHGLALTGLTDDDHTQYVLLAGRSGGQTWIGGTGSGDDATIQSTSHATKGTLFLDDKVDIYSDRDYVAGGSVFFNVNPIITNVNQASPQLIAFNLSPTYEYDTAISVTPANLTFMNFQPEIKSESGIASGTDNMSLNAFFLNPIFDGTNGPRTVNQMFGMLARPRINGGTGALMAGIRATVDARNAGTTVTTAYGFYASDPVVSGATITTFVGLRIDNITKATNDWSMQIGNAQSYHVGDFKIGAASAPAAPLDIIQPLLGGAEPVLKLEQIDKSEEFIRFVGKADNASLVSSIVEEAAVTTATRAGFLRMFVTDDGNQITDQAYYVPIFTLA